ncbi:MAG: pyruvate kinase [Candidatus Omnitrophica bacterium]|nr:pyruvate kinase [Candidatus Omnitrophota bacterium]
MKLNYNRDTQIIATLGPASIHEDILTQMARKGLNIVRLNFSHGSYDQHQGSIDLVRKINRKHKFNVKILQDLEGYRIRIGRLNQPIELKRGATHYLTNNKSSAYGSPTKALGDDGGCVIPAKAGIGAAAIFFDYSGNIKDIPNGSQIFIDDGRICLRVKSRDNHALVVTVVDGGMLQSRKGINIPGLKLKQETFTSKDKKDLKFGIENKVDLIAQSFVRDADDIMHVVRRVKPILPHCRVISKIENHEGISHVDSIIAACDGIMVARGDLGVSLPIFQVPLMQKYIIRRCNRNKKFVIVATQMLESMTENNRPTRAEVSDVANAILDGADAVMLSGETAVGKFPVETIDMMAKIVDYTEKSQQINMVP